jgi:hypothetical protein
MVTGKLLACLSRIREVPELTSYSTLTKMTSLHYYSPTASVV